jgi:hypothetical protein
MHRLVAAQRPHFNGCRRLFLEVLLAQIVNFSNAKHNTTLIHLLFVAFGLFIGTATAQDYRAKLTATVVDTAGAVVPNAVLELERGSTHTLKETLRFFF